MPPPLPHSSLGCPLTTPVGGQDRIVQMEVFLDFTCPFSHKMWKTLYQATNDNTLDFPFLQIVFHQLPQGWHPQSSYLHEAAIAVRQLGTKADYLTYCNLLFTNQTHYFDKNCANLTRSQFYEKLANLSDGISTKWSAADVRAKLTFSEGEEMNCGNATTKDLKFAIKHHRKRGVHVTPTVFINGIEAVQVSSSWSVEQFKDMILGL